MMGGWIEIPVPPRYSTPLSQSPHYQEVRHA